MTEADFRGEFYSSFCRRWSDGKLQWLELPSAYEGGGLSSRASLQ